MPQAAPLCAVEPSGCPLTQQLLPGKAPVGARWSTAVLVRAADCRPFLLLSSCLCHRPSGVKQQQQPEQLQQQASTQQAQQQRQRQHGHEGRRQPGWPFGREVLLRLLALQDVLQGQDAL